jgi:hypothetical protein
VFLVAFGCALVAYLANEETNVRVAELNRAGETGSGRIEELRAEQTEGRDFLFGSICAVLGFVGIGGAAVYLKSVRQKSGLYVGWTGSRSGALTFALFGAIAPGLVGFHASLLDKPDPGVVTGFCAALAGMAVVSGVVGYHVGRRPQATGLLAVWTGFDLAVAGSVFAGTRSGAGLLSGQAGTTLTPTEYAAVILFLWVAAGVAVLVTGAVIRRPRRRVASPARITSSPS